MTEQTHCGYIAIVGRPNVGKSTLLNSLIGEKVSIISRKPQTTRHRILGISTEDNYQYIFVDTPGLQQKHKSQLNRYMNKTALKVLHDVDLILFVVEAMQWTEDDAWLAKKLVELKEPIVVVVNKVDLIKQKDRLLPYLKTLQENLPALAYVPVSAKSAKYLTELQKLLCDNLPESPFYFYPEQVTDRDETFRIAELIREQMMTQYSEELPYAVNIQIEKLTLVKEVYHIHALIWIERAGQKQIIVGKNGERLKTVGTKARYTIEKLLGKKVFLQLWVKVKSGWSDDKEALQQFGYDAK